MESLEMLKPKDAKETPDSKAVLTPEQKKEALVYIKALEEKIEQIDAQKANLREAIDTNNKENIESISRDLKETIKEAKVIQRKMEGRDTLEPISTTYTYKNEEGKEITENIEINIESKLEQALSFYKSHGVEISEDFSDQIKDIYERNMESIQEQIEKFGFDEVLIVRANINLNDTFDEEMTRDYKKSDGKIGEPTYWGEGKEEISSDARSSKDRIILVHKNKAKDLYNTPETLPILKETLGKKAGSFKPEEGLTLEEYYIFQRQYFEETGKHLDEKGATWLPGSKSGSRVVCADWCSGDGQLCVRASDADASDSDFGCRLSRSFL